MNSTMFTLSGYTPLVVEYFFYFMLYSFFGWVLEGSYNLYSKGSFRKEGFLKGPFKPMYGFAPLLLIYIRDLELPILLFLLFALIIPSVVEYSSGWMLKSLFHKQWWDYSNIPFQLQGHICLRFSLYWWVLSIGCLYILHPIMEWLFRSVGRIWELSFPLMVLLFAIDLLWTCWTRLRSVKKLELGEG